MNKKHDRRNPFFEPYATPHNTIPFDRIAFDDYEEAIMEGIRREDEEIRLITTNPDEPTFDNTLTFKDETHGEHYYDLLDRVSNALSCMLNCETSDQLEALAQKMSPLLTKHANDMSLNPELFRRVKHVYHHHRPLTDEEQQLLENSYRGFVRSGALLDDKGKEQLRQLTEEMGLLTLQFAQNLLKERKAFALHITNPDDLDGLPDTSRQAAALAAKERGMEGYVFTLDYPSYSPFLTYSTRRHLREQMYMAYNTLCTHDNDANNTNLCKRLVNLRREMAQLLGYASFADYVLEHRMAANKEGVYALLNSLTAAYKPTALEELKHLEQMARQMEGEQFVMQPWDTAYYSHKLKRQLYDIDAEMLRPYLPLDRVTQGVFQLAHTLYGITFRENKQIPTYHPDVRAYEVFDSDGTYLAVFYADFFPRDGKSAGAWMTDLQAQWIDRKGNNIRPHVSVVMNFTKPTDQKPSLLTLGEVETFLHEFGHALHGIFANTRFASMSGTNVWRDFVELPSQLMENYATEKQFLSTFAFHYETGEPMPDHLIDRIVKSRNHMVATACLRQVGFSLIDMAFYTMQTPFDEDIPTFENNARAATLLTPPPPGTCMTTQFAHIMEGGYSAGYYSYKWAEVLDADAFAEFKANGIFDKETARSFRDNILAKGGTVHPMTLYKNFKGKEPTIDALLERNGIKTRPA